MYYYVRLCGVPASCTCIYTRIYLLYARARTLSPCLALAVLHALYRAPALAGVLAADDVHTGSLPPVRGTKASGEGGGDEQHSASHPSLSCNSESEHWVVEPATHLCSFHSLL